MMMTKERMELINGKQRVECYYGTHDLNVHEFGKKVYVFTNNWCVCNVDELDEMIEELQFMKSTIETIERHNLK